VTGSQDERAHNMGMQGAVLKGHQTDSERQRETVSRDCSCSGPSEAQLLEPRRDNAIMNGVET